MKEGGIGGFEVQPVYPLELDRNFACLSDEFLEDLRFVGAKARELGLRYDLTLGSGWPYGGPHIPLPLAAGRLRIVRGAAPQLADGEKLIASFPGQSLYFVTSRMMVKRAAVGAEGFVLNRCDRAAIDAHLRAVGDRLAQSFCPPYQVEVTGLLHSGANRARVEGANPAINELAKGPLPDYQALTAKYGERFQPQDVANLAPLPRDCWVRYGWWCDKRARRSGVMISPPDHGVQAPRVNPSLGAETRRDCGYSECMELRL